MTFSSAKKILPEQSSNVSLLNGLVIFQTSQCLPLDVVTPSEAMLTEANQAVPKKAHLQVVDDTFQADIKSFEANSNDEGIPKPGSSLEAETNGLSRKKNEKPVIETKQKDSPQNRSLPLRAEKPEISLDKIDVEMARASSLTPEERSFKDSSSVKDREDESKSSLEKSDVKTKAENKNPDEVSDELIKSEKSFLEKQAFKDISKFDKNREVEAMSDSTLPNSLQSPDDFSDQSEYNTKKFHYFEEEVDKKLEASQAKENKTPYKNVIEDKFVKNKKTGTFSFSSIWGRKKDKLLKTSIQQKKITNVSHGEELNYFFRATDDQLLYNLGESFHRDYKKGIKHFAFAHVNSEEPQKRSILGVASLLKYFENNRILIITSKMDESYFAPFKKESTPQLVEISSLPGFKYTVHKSYSLFYLEVEELERRSQLSKVNVLPTVIKCLMADYDVVICDLPPIEERKDQYDIYLPLLQIIENVTLTISLQKSRFSEINELKDYFSSYKIRIKGSVVERHSEPRREIR